MARVRQRLGVSERRACRVLGQARTTHRRRSKRGADEEALREDVVRVARRFGRYGYRMVTGMLRTEGWVVNHKRVERIWRQEGLKVPKKQPRRGRLWLRDGSCIRLRPLYRHHVWAYDFVADRTHDGRRLKMLTVLDEYSRECLAIVVARRLQSDDVLETLSGLFAKHGPPANIRSDNGPEFTATVVREWLRGLGVKTLFIEPGSPWENGYNESFNGTLGEEVLKREIFYSLEEAQVLIEQWRREYNTIRPHSSLAYQPPAPEAIRPEPAFPQSPEAPRPSPQAPGGGRTNTVGGTALGGWSELCLGKRRNPADSGSLRGGDEARNGLIRLFPPPAGYGRPRSHRGGRWFESSSDHRVSREAPGSASCRGARLWGAVVSAEVGR